MVILSWKPEIHPWLRDFERCEIDHIHNNNYIHFGNFHWKKGLEGPDSGGK
jgi:hypothetical protein